MVLAAVVPNLWAQRAPFPFCKATGCQRGNDSLAAFLLPSHPSLSFWLCSVLVCNELCFANSSAAQPVDEWRKLLEAPLPGFFVAFDGCSIEYRGGPMPGDMNKRQGGFISSGNRRPGRACVYMGILPVFRVQVYCSAAGHSPPFSVFFSRFTTKPNAKHQKFVLTCQPIVP